MSLRLFNAVPRGGILALATLFAGFLSYFSIRNALAVEKAEPKTLDGYEHATKLEPDDFRNWYLLGRYWQYNFEEADIDRSIQAYLTSLSLNPRYANSWMDLATAYESKGDLPSARKAYLQAKKSYPVSPEVAWRYGNFLLRQGELDPAFLEMHRAVEADHKLGAEAFSRSLRVES